MRGGPAKGWLDPYPFIEQLEVGLQPFRIVGVDAIRQLYFYVRFELHLYVVRRATEVTGGRTERNGPVVNDRAEVDGEPCEILCGGFRINGRIEPLIDWVGMQPARQQTLPR